MRDIIDLIREVAPHVLDTWRLPALLRLTRGVNSVLIEHPPDRIGPIRSMAPGVCARYTILIRRRSTAAAAAARATDLPAVTITGLLNVCTHGPRLDSTSAGLRATMMVDQGRRMARALVTHFESEAGQAVHARRGAECRLRPWLARDYVGVRHHAASPQGWSQPPVPLVSLIVTFEGPVSTAERTLPGAWLGGFGGVSQRVTVGAAHASVDVKLQPLGAYALCGRSLRELAGECVGLEEIFGQDGQSLAGRLTEAEGWDERFDLLDEFLLDRAARASEPHPLVTAAWALLRQSDGTMRIGALAAELGCSRRHLAALFHEQVGLAPKTTARLLRFQRVRERIKANPQRWADIAYAYGYYDQAHLNRDFRELASTTPTAFLAELGPDVSA